MCKVKFARVGEIRKKLRITDAEFFVWLFENTWNKCAEN